MNEGPSGGHPTELPSRAGQHALRRVAVASRWLWDLLSNAVFVCAVGLVFLLLVFSDWYLHVIAVRAALFAACFVAERAGDLLGKLQPAR